MKGIGRCLCRARRARSRGAVRLSGGVVVVVGVDLLVGTVVCDGIRDIVLHGGKGNSDQPVERSRPEAGHRARHQTELAAPSGTN